MPDVKKMSSTKEEKGKEKAAKAETKGVPAAKPSRQVLYPEPKTKHYFGETPLTAKKAEELLGWVEEGEDEKFGSNYCHELRSLYRPKVRLLHNNINRRMSSTRVSILMDTILRKKWRRNMEPIIIGKCGEVISGQKQLAALILAAKTWKDHREDWPKWRTEPTIEKVVSCGCDEDDDTVNTVDMCQSRTLTDVFYRSKQFRKLAPKVRAQSARCCDLAIRLLWVRTGVKTDPYAPYRTHPECLDFLDRHEGLLEAVQHILDEDDGGKIAGLLPTGYAAALLYLMGSSGSSLKKYLDAGRDESSLLWKHWDAACDYWVKLANGEKAVGPVREALAQLVNRGRPLSEKFAVLVLGWLAYVQGGKVKDSDLSLGYATKPSGVEVLVNAPACGGIDIVDPRDADEATIPANDPPPAEIASRAAKVRGEGPQEVPVKEPPRPKKKGFKAGQAVWVSEPDKEPWKGRIISASSNGAAAKIKVENGHQGAGTIRAVKTSLLSTKPPALPEPVEDKPEPVEEVPVAEPVA